jgi:predicted SAM-dependent methyltransferase
MNWKAKAYLQKVLGWLPFGNSINYFFQKKITKNLPVSEKIFYEKVSLAKYHFEKFSKFTKNPTSSSFVFYEFGAGWDLIIPMIYYVKGIKNQILIDINKKLKFELINDTIQRFNIDKLKIESIIGEFINQMPVIQINNLTQLEQTFGIKYLAPMDASNSNFKDNHFDFISNTSTLEHIPEQFILPIMKECHRILKEDAIMSCVIDLQDHYSYFDNHLSVYNFLQFSEREWAKYNHPIQYQNRLRSSDFINFFKEVGFEILEIEKEYPDLSEEKELKSINLNKKFSNYNFEDLSVKVLKIVLKKVKY